MTEKKNETVASLLSRLAKTQCAIQQVQLEIKKIQLGILYDTWLPITTGAEFAVDLPDYVYNQGDEDWPSTYRFNRPISISLRLDMVPNGEHWRRPMLRIELNPGWILGNEVASSGLPEPWVLHINDVSMEAMPTVTEYVRQLHTSKSLVDAMLERMDEEIHEKKVSLKSLTEQASTLMNQIDSH